MIWVGRHPQFHPGMLGFIPQWLDEADPRDAKTQLDEGYGYGGMWRNDKMTIDKDDRLIYPGDPPQEPLAETRLHGQRIILYPCSFVAVIEPDGSFLVQRMD